MSTNLQGAGNPMSPVSEMHAAISAYVTGGRRSFVLFYAVILFARFAFDYLEPPVIWQPKRDGDFLIMLLFVLVSLFFNYVATDAAMRRLDTKLQEVPRSFVADEMLRMADVRRFFRALNTIMLVLLAASLAGLFLSREGERLLSIWATLALLSAVMLAFGVAHSRRAGVYVDHICALLRAQEGRA